MYNIAVFLCLFELFITILCYKYVIAVTIYNVFALCMLAQLLLLYIYKKQTLVGMFF